jgi:hypothetical protein
LEGARIEMISNFSLAGYAIGILVAVMSAVRWFVIYPDFSEAATFIYIGISITAFAWLYNQNLKLNNKVAGIEDYLAENK